jgi:hypothetical protein
MSKAIDLLEKLGHDSDLRARMHDEVHDALSRSEISSELAAALSTGNQSQLIVLLGAKTNVSCLVLPAKQDEDDADEQEKKDDDDDSSEEKSASAVRRGACRAASYL